jgi:hypothetical protein
MSNATGCCPKCIWFHLDTNTVRVERHFGNEVAYIRLDFVQDLIETLKVCRPHSGHAENLIDICLGHFEDLEML